jgi:hypothetical protein
MMYYGMYAVKILASFNPKTTRNVLYWLAIYKFCARSEISSCAPYFIPENTLRII